MAKRYEDRYGRGGYRRGRDYSDDRGYMDRAGDEVRSWFGDDDAERRRQMDEQRDRQHDRGYGDDWTRSEWQRSERQRDDWTRPAWDDRARQRAQGPDEWRGRAATPAYQDYGRTWSSRDWDRDRGAHQYGETYREQDRYSPRAQRPASTWSVDEGRTEFGGERYGRGPKGYQRSDNRILEDVCDRLTYSDVDAGEIEVRVENGEVTLSGTVRDRWDKRRAEDVAEEVSGVRDVHNNIRVHRDDRGIGQSETSLSDQPGTVLGVNPTESSTIANARPKAKT